MLNPIEQAIYNEKERLDLHPEGVDFANCVSNPLGQGPQPGVTFGYGPVSMGARIPDGTRDTIVVSVYFQYTNPTASTQSGWVELELANATNAGVMRLLYGNDPFLGTDTPTTLVATLSSSNTLAFAILGASANRYRVVAAALQAVSYGSPEDSGGVLLGALTPDCALTAPVPTYRVYSSTFTDYLMEEPRRLMDGMTIRSRITSENFTFRSGHTYGTHTSGQQNFQRMPAIGFKADSNTGSIMFRGVVHYEVKMPHEASCIPMPLPFVEDELPKLLGALNTLQVVVSGNSFRDFLKGVRNFFVGAARVIMHPVAQTVFKALAGV